MTPEYPSSLEFLKKWSTDGPWTLTAINIDRQGIDTRTFEPREEEALLKWLDQQNKARNIYFNVNLTLQDLQKKAKRKELKEVRWLHVDLDPRVGEDVQEEQERILNLLLNPPESVPPPTVVLFSGGGYQGFWKLEEPIEINGSLERAEDAKCYNLQLEILFGGDRCHNIDRIMRLPGTINWPDEKKKAKGRTKALAKLMEFHEDRVYPISSFTKAQEVQSANGGSIGGGHPVQISGNVDRLKDVNDPRLNKVSNLGKVVIVQGQDPEDPSRFAKEGTTSELDRSKALLFACCEMVRGECDDDTIYAVITDPDFGISVSVLDKGSLTEKYAIRQIGQAREKAIAPELQELNARHAVVANWAGKCRILEEVWDPNLDRFKLTKQSFEDFRNRYMHRMVEVASSDNKVSYMPLGKWWLQHSHRKQYDTISFAPGHDIPNSYNLWRGFACDAIPGDCSQCLEHIKNNLCQGNEQHYDYLIGWMASAVQHPARPGYSAIVLRGTTGTGKSFFVTKIFGSLFGRHLLQVSDPKHIVGSFNAHLRDCVILFAEEAFYAGDKKHESILKMLITEDMLIIEPKGIDAEMGANCVHLLMASNEMWVVPAALDDRRFFVLDVGAVHKEDKIYFDALETELNTGGREALLHFLMNYDLSKFNVRSVPKTKALQEQKLHSMDPYQEWWFNKLRTGLVRDEDNSWNTRVAVLHLQNDFLHYARDYHLTRRGNSTKLGQMVKKFLPVGCPGPKQSATPLEVETIHGTTRTIRRPYFYKLPSLQECRDHWDKMYGGPYDWTKPMDEVPIPDELPF